MAIALAQRDLLIGDAVAPPRRCLPSLCNFVIVFYNFVIETYLEGSQ